VKILDARFVTSAVDARGIPADGIPHVALVGRSNVGKSTLINALAGSRLARTSAAPGKTRLANLYRLEIDGGAGGPGRWRVCLVDLPGYGYARGGQASVEELARVAQSYFDAAQADVAQAFPPSRVAEKRGALRRDLAEALAEAGRPANDATLKRRATYQVAGVLHLVDARHPGLDADIEAAAWLATLGIERAVIATKVDKLSRAERTKNLGELQRQLGMAPLPISAPGGEGLGDLWRLIAKLSRRP
jgi:GTP-binding protein